MDAIDRELVELECRIADYRQPQNIPKDLTVMQDIERMSISMPGKLVNEIDDYRRASAALVTRAAAIRELLAIGLAYVSKPPALPLPKREQKR